MHGTLGAFIRTCRCRGTCVRCAAQSARHVDPQIVRLAVLSQHAEGRRHGRVAIHRDQHRGENVLRTAGWRDAAQELLAIMHVALGSARAPTSGSMSALAGTVLVAKHVPRGYSASCKARPAWLARC